HRVLRAAQLAAGHGRGRRRRPPRVPASHGAAHGGAVAHPARRDHPRRALGRARHPEPGVRPRAAGQGAGGPARVPARGEERRTPDLHRAGAAVRLSARRLGPGGGGVLLARDRLSAEPGHLPARHPGAAGRDPGAGDLLRAPEPRRRPAADRRRSPDRASLMAIAGALPHELESAPGAPMSYWRAVGWRLAHDRMTLAAGAVLALIVLSAVLAPWLAPYDPNAGS